MWGSPPVEQRLSSSRHFVHINIHIWPCVTKSDMDALCYQSLLRVGEMCSRALVHADMCTRGHCSCLASLYSCAATKSVLQQSTDGKPGGGVSSPEGAQVTLEDRWDPFSVQGASLEVSTFVTGDMGGDKSLRHRLRAVIDELGLAAPSPSPPPPCRPLPSSCLHGAGVGGNPPHSLVFL